ncbi:MAG: hypothetical protein J6N21_19790 [Butyrivibrio sp.]|nr:hypothetical protein [Butyrivibrio sp.]
MNKKTVDSLIPRAVDVLKEVNIADKNGNINKTFRGQISTFGAAIINGSLISAVAFFSDDGKGTVERSNLLKAVKLLIVDAESYSDLFDYVRAQGKNHEKAVKQRILNASVALKLAMNLYNLE